ncbi:hypothetical protein [Streptomyces melanogenes]
MPARALGDDVGSRLLYPAARPGSDHDDQDYSGTREPEAARREGRGG